MSDQTIAHVSDTAFWVAWHRAQEGKRPDALFNDPLAAKLAGDRGRRIAARMGIARAMAWSMALRTYILDGFIRDAIKDGVDMIVNLGAGLDTRPYRLDLPTSLNWVEVDFEAVIAYKSSRLADETPACHLRRIACDLGDDPARRALLHDLTKTGQKILVLTEGVMPYLSAQQVEALAQDLQAQPQIAVWLTDYFSPLFHKLSARGRIARQLERNAPFQFMPGDAPEAWSRFFAACGWQIDHVTYLGEEGARLGRDMPANWLIRLVMRLTPEARLQPYRRMMGFVRLTRGQSVRAL
jgi:methyltransferase (TIGR00027 family)